jgi:hypothetical protein
MAEKKATKEVSANPMLVEFPRDPYQSTQQLRSVGLKASARVGTQKDKLKLYIETLDVLKAHAIAAFKKRQGLEKETQEAAIARAAEEQRINEERTAARIKQLEAELASVKGVVDPEEDPEEDPETAPEVAEETE